MSTGHSGPNTRYHLTSESLMAPSELESCPMLQEGKLRLRELCSHTIKRKKNGIDPRMCPFNTMLAVSASGLTWTRFISLWACGDGDRPREERGQDS